MSNDDDEDWDDDLEDTTDVNAAVREERRQFTVREEIGEVIRDFKGYGWRLGAAALQLARWSGRIAWVGYTVMLFANLPLFMKVRPLSLLCAGGVPPLPARRLQKSTSLHRYNGGGGLNKLRERHSIDAGKLLGIELVGTTRFRSPCARPSSRRATTI